MQIFAYMTYHWGWWERHWVSSNMSKNQIKTIIILIEQNGINKKRIYRLFCCRIKWQRETVFPCIVPGAPVFLLQESTAGNRMVIVAFRLFDTDRHASSSSCSDSYSSCSECFLQWFSCESSWPPEAAVPQVTDCSVNGCYTVKNLIV